MRAGAVLWLDPTIRLVNPYVSGNNSNQSTAEHVNDYFLQSSDDPIDNLVSHQSHLVTNVEPRTARHRFHYNNKSVSQGHVATSVILDPGNDTGMQAMYPADQASLLHLDNHYVNLESHVEQPSEENKRSKRSSVVRNNSKKYMERIGTDAVKAKNSLYDRWKRNLDVEDVMQEENTLIEEESYTSKLFGKQTKSSNTGQLPPQNFVPFVKPFDASDGVFSRDLSGSSTNNEVLDSYALSPGEVTDRGYMGSLVAAETGVLSRIDETFIEVRTRLFNIKKLIAAKLK